MSVDVTGPMHERYDEILTERALGLIETLHRAYDERRRELLARRQERVAAIGENRKMGGIGSPAAVVVLPDAAPSSPATWWTVG